MNTKKIKFKLQKCLNIAREGVLKAMALKIVDNTYAKLMKKVVKRYRKVVRLAAKLEKVTPEPLIRIQIKIINELRKYNEYKRNNKGMLQLGRSTLAPIIFLTTVGLLLLAIEKETLSQIDNNESETNTTNKTNTYTLPTTPELNTSEQYSAPGETSENTSEEETVDYKVNLVEGIKYYKEEKYKEAIAQWDKIPSDSEYREKADKFTKMAKKKLEDQQASANKTEEATEEETRSIETNTKTTIASTSEDTETPTTDYKAILIEGIKYYKEKQYEDAIAEWKKIPEDSEHYSKAQQYITNAQTKIEEEQATGIQADNKTEETNATVETTEETAVDYKSILDNGQVLYNNNEYENAITEWEKIPEDSEYYNQAQQNIQTAQEHLATEETTEETEAVPIKSEKASAEETKPTATEEEYKAINESYEIHQVKRGDSLWKITENYYGQFSNGNIYFFIDNILSPMNNKGKMRDYKWTDIDKRNPHLIYPAEKIKVPDLKEVDPNAIPQELKNVVQYDENSKLYTAQINEGKIVLLNPSKNKATVTSI